jgi:hypothetical protein
VKRVVASAAIAIFTVLASTTASASTGTGWRAQPVPKPAHSIDILGGVSCPTATNCVAVGSYSQINENTGLFAERWNGSTWALQVLPIPAGSYFLLQSVSCQQSGPCTAVGSAMDASQQWHALIERANGTSWAIQQDAAPARTMLSGVSCPSAQACTAVGQNLTATGTATRNGFAEHWDGTTWAVQPTPVPRSTTTGTILSGISCVAALYCTAVGDFAPHGMPLAEHEG